MLECSFPSEPVHGLGTECSSSSTFHMFVLVTVHLLALPPQLVSGLAGCITYTECAVSRPNPFYPACPDMISWRLVLFGFHPSVSEISLILYLPSEIAVISSETWLQAPVRLNLQLTAVRCIAELAVPSESTRTEPLCFWRVEEL